MSWFSDAWDWGVDAVSDSGDWIDRTFSTTDGSWLNRNFLGDNSWWDQNGGSLDKYVNAGQKLFNLFSANNSRSGSRSDILNMYENIAAQDQAYNQQYQQYLEQAQAASASNNAARMRAAAEALKVQKKYLRNLRKQYQPYVKAAKELTPKMAQNYSQFLDTTGLLNQYLAPVAMKAMADGPKPAYELNVPQSAYSVGTPTQQAVEFPSLEQILAGRK